MAWNVECTLFYILRFKRGPITKHFSLISQTNCLNFYVEFMHRELWPTLKWNFFDCSSEHNWIPVKTSSRTGLNHFRVAQTLRLFAVFFFLSARNKNLNFANENANSKISYVTHFMVQIFSNYSWNLINIFLRILFKTQEIFRSNLIKMLFNISREMWSWKICAAAAHTPKLSVHCEFLSPQINVCFVCR